MFRKFLDQVRNINSQKLKKDADLHLKRLEFYFKDHLKDLKTKTKKLGLESRIEKAQNFWKQKRNNFNLRKLDEQKSKKLDELNYKFETKIREAVSGVKNMMNRSKNAPNLIKNQTQNLGGEMKSFFKGNYIEAKNHVKQYFKDNQKFFEYKLNSYRNSYRKKKNNFLIIGGLAIFTYAAGANLPYAIVKYKLAQESMERANPDYDEIEEVQASPSPTILHSATTELTETPKTEPAPQELLKPASQNSEKGSRTKAEVSETERKEYVYDVMLVDEATMFPSVNQPSLLGNSENQPDSEIIRSVTISSNSVTSNSEVIPTQRSEKIELNFNSKDAFLQCKVCQKAAEGFCCACTTEKFCSHCFRAFHSNLPNFHRFFLFNGSSGESVVVKKFNTLNQKLSRLA